MTGDEHPKTASICGGVAGVRCTNGTVGTVGIPKHKIHIRRVMSLSSACSCDATSCFSTRVSTMHLVCQPLLASARDAAGDAAMLGLDSTTMHLKVVFIFIKTTYIMTIFIMNTYITIIFNHDHLHHDHLHHDHLHYVHLHQS